MTSSLACLAGAPLFALADRGDGAGEPLGRMQTPFGASEPIWRLAGDGCYVVPLCSADGRHTWPGAVNHRATLYALKALGVRCVLGVSAAGAITHNYNVGDIVVVGDLIDRTARRANTFFEHTGIAALRQFPVFCPFLCQALTACLDRTGRPCRRGSTLVVTEGPRLETPAEVRFYAASGGELVGHAFAPEAFLAKELELCFAGVAYVANYAETGSCYRPFSARDLFGGLTSVSESDRLDAAVRTIAALVEDVNRYVGEQEPTCECGRTMRHAVEKFGLGEDWRQWFTVARGRYASVPPRTGGAVIDDVSQTTHPS
ncbi:MAG: MTAP family purine nucleoside phosphorylase [Planctomycetes bacterium]|nr:MTAP family purine nucleoside phosphorylase [Planctomycetota bacterium]